jgi:hypothetical protein
MPDPRQHKPKCGSPLHYLRQFRRDGLFRLQSDQRIHELASFENKHRRNRADIKSPGRLRILIHIQFGDDVPSARFRRELIKRRCEHPTRPAPGSPAIDQDRRISCLGQRIGESLIRQCNRMIRCRRRFQRRMATPANRLRGPIRIDAIFHSAF